MPDYHRYENCPAVAKDLWRFGQGGAAGGELMRLTALPGGGPEWSFWPASMWIPGPGCYGIQMDTPQRSSLVVFEAY